LVLAVDASGSSYTHRRTLPSRAGLRLPPNRDFNKTELAEHAGVTRQTVGNDTDLLIELELTEEVPNTSPRRYRVADNIVVRELFELNSALNSVGEEQLSTKRSQFLTEPLRDSGLPAR
jgi:hypothetical protein